MIVNLCSSNQPYFVEVVLGLYYEPCYPPSIIALRLNLTEYEVENGR